MDVTAYTRQAFLDDAWDSAPAEGNTLRDELRKYEKAATSLFSSSGSIQSVGKNSANQSYSGPGVGRYTSVQIQEAWRSLINLFDLCYVDLTGVPSDDAVYAEMKLRLCTPVTEAAVDISLARCATGRFV